MSRGTRARLRGMLCRTGIMLSVAALTSLGLAAPAAGAPGAPYQRPGETERVSVASDGAEGHGASSVFGMSADGRYVPFRSDSSNLVPGDTNRVSDVFVHDRQTTVTERVSVASDGAQANRRSDGSMISPDGRYVAFDSHASNLVPDDTNNVADVFVHDRQTGVTERVSVASNGDEATGGSEAPKISADGRYVAFWSSADNLIPGDTNLVPDVFVHDRQTGVTARVSVASDGTETGGHGPPGAISTDGRYIAFSSYGPLVPDDLNDNTDVFVHDRQTGVTARVSVASDGAEANARSGIWASMSADGRYVAFDSHASNLVPGDTNRCGPTEAVEIVTTCIDVFVHDRQTGVTERVSVASDGAESSGAEISGDSLLTQHGLSADGRYVAFWSSADNLVPGDTNGVNDVFAHDRQTGVTERVSVASDGAESSAESSEWSMKNVISADGRYVAFESYTDDLVPGDTNFIPNDPDEAGRDVFVRDRGPDTGVGAVAAHNRPGEVVVSGWATFSGTTIATAEDPSNDGADTLGAEITAASVVYQVEQEALLLRLRLASLPAVNAPRPRGGPIHGVPGSGAGVPQVVYRFGFELENTRYEVRGSRVPSAGFPPVESRFVLYECASTCVEAASLSGGIGTTGNEVRVAVPLQTVGAAVGATLTGLKASASASEPLTRGDEVELPDAAISISRVELGIAPPSAPEADVPFSTQTTLIEGRFSGTLDASSVPPGTYRVWARACLGQTCGTRTADVTR